MGNERKTTTRDMTEGFIPVQVLLFALPILLGNVFQMLYNTVDSIVVGKFVSTQALAAVAATTMIVNIGIFFFNGFSSGATVVIGRYFGAKDFNKLHVAIETTMAATFILSISFSILGVVFVKPMLHLMSTPDDVFNDATLYLRIYFSGFAGLLIYNMGSGILRAVGDSKRPLYFLAVTSLLNIALDLIFVLVFDMGIAGVGFATIISQFVSSGLIILLLSKTEDVYKMTWNDLQIDKGIIRQILSVGIPAGLQAVVTAVSNVFVQSYINHFGSSVMAGWGCYNKLDQYAMLPLQSMAQSSTTFVSQNVGAGKKKRADTGAFVTIGMGFLIILVIVISLILFASPAVGLFTDDPSVIEAGVMFIKTNNLFLALNCICHVTAGALRGWGNAKAPMIIMLSCFVGVRQSYLYILTHYIVNEAKWVGFGYPVGWMSCATTILIYYFIYRKKHIYNQGELK